MEKRSLIKFGKNSYVVSLPKNWVAANKLEKGSTIYLEQKPASITITGQQTIQKERKAKIHCEGKTIDDIENELIACYKAGFTTIILEGRNIQHQAAPIKQLLQNLFGMEVIEHTFTRIVVKDLVDMQQLTVPTLVRRMDLMIRSMLDDATEEGASTETIIERDIEVNRIEYLLARIVRRVLDNPSLGNLIGVGVVDAYHMNRVAWTLERLGDYIKYVSSVSCEPEGDVQHATAFLAELKKRYIDVMRTYYSKDAEQAIIQHGQLKMEIAKLDKQRSKTCNPLIIENIKNALRDLRVILRVTVEASHAEE